MSGVPLETCWAFNERWNNKFCYKVASCWLFLLNHTTIHGSMNIKRILHLQSILTKSFWPCYSISMIFQEVTFHGVHHTTPAYISCFPVIVSLLLNITSYLLKLWVFSEHNIYILFLRESVRGQNFFLCFVFKCGPHLLSSLDFIVVRSVMCKVRHGDKISFLYSVSIFSNLSFNTA